MPRTAKIVQLSDSELSSLTQILSRGETRARVQTRARILDLLGRSKHPEQIAQLLSVSQPTVFTIKRRYLSDGLEAALNDQKRCGRPVEIDGESRARVTALACSTPPEGHARWSLRLLADTAIELGYVESVSHNTVGEMLKKTNFRRT